jgi:UDP-N-acetylmuramate dehydrogenase
LIDQSGWKGKQLNQVGMFHKQAWFGELCRCNIDRCTRNVSGSTKDVFEKFDVHLEPEPVLYNELGLIENH